MISSLPHLVCAIAHIVLVSCALKLECTTCFCDWKLKDSLGYIEHTLLETLLGWIFWYSCKLIVLLLFTNVLKVIEVDCQLIKF